MTISIVAIDIVHNPLVLLLQRGVGLLVVCRHMIELFFVHHSNLPLKLRKVLAFEGRGDSGTT